jgi:hypothetical protein
MLKLVVFLDDLSNFHIMLIHHSEQSQQKSAN